VSKQQEALSRIIKRKCRIHNSSVAYIAMNASVSCVGNHPLALVTYNCNHKEFVRHD